MQFYMKIQLFKKTFDKVLYKNSNLKNIQLLKKLNFEFFVIF